MFKIGDKVRIKKGDLNYAITVPGCEGIIIEIFSSGFVEFQITKHLNRPQYNGDSYEVELTSLELIKSKKELLSEIDYLNAFQENFKEGI